MSKAIFLDRDGTINEEVNYLKRTEDIKFYPNTIKALLNFKNSEFLNIIITNQSGIARGYLTEDGLEEIHSEFRKLLTVEGNVLVDDIFYSPYHTDGIIEKYKLESEDRKPGTGMIRKSILKHNIDLTESFFIGDSYTDMLCAKNAGLKKILVETGYGKKDLGKCKRDNIEIEYVAKDLYDASNYIQNISNQLSK